MTRFTETPQWESGEQAADFLDRFFGQRGWQIWPTSHHEERALCLGDRHYRRNGQHFTIEYKSGLQTAQTGNVFLETISVDRDERPGWVYTCRADYLFYAVLPQHKILIFEPLLLRLVIEDLKQRFPEVHTSHRQNQGYNTHGVLVPLEYAETHLTWKVIDTRTTE